MILTYHRPMDHSLLLGAEGATASVWQLFMDSRDLFTVLLILGSLSGVTVIFMCLLEIRESRILPAKITERVKDLVAAKRWADLEELVRTDGAYLCRAIRPVMAKLHGDRTALREVAELAASEESARWFRKIETLNVIGNLGPLIGLAGTVWGMILAFTSLGVAGGQADPSTLSLGISKALFHTLLGLCLAIPCLLIFGLYRSKVDRICTRGMMLAADIVDRLPTNEGEQSHGARVESARHATAHP